MAVGKNLLSIFFSFTLVMGLLPCSAFADPSDSSSNSTELSSDALNSNESEFADGGVASKPDPTDPESETDFNGYASGGEDVGFGVGDEFANEQELSAPDYSDGRLAIWADGLDDPSDVTDVYPPDTNEIEAYANGSNLQPMSFSSEMLYFCKYESSCNYDQGLSSGDGYHAMGYFQFDNRYGLGSFLKAAYNYNPSTYSALKVIGDRYGWDVTGATRSNGAFTQLGNDLNAAWHAAYKANPTEFSNLQNGWAYIDSYNGSLGARGCLKAFGINLDNRPDCIKGLCWGMVNLFGAGGGASYINNGNYYGANWFFKNSGINDSMSDEAFVTTLCDYVVNNVAKRYPKQSIYWTGWQNRYKSEKTDCLRYIQSNIYPIEDNFASINKAPNSVSDGQYLLKTELGGMGVLQVGSDGSASETSLKICSSTMGEEQKFAIERDSSSGYVRIKNMQSFRYLGLVGSNGRYSQAVVQKEYSVDDRTLLWQIAESGGALIVKPAVNTGYCLDVTGGSFYEGVSVCLYKVNGTAAQRFSLISTSPKVEGGRTVADGVYSLASKADPSKVLDVAGGSVSNGGNVQAWAANGTAAQRFRLTCGDDGFYTIQNLKSGKVLDVADANLVPGTNVQQWDANGTDAQKWAVRANADGSYTIVSKANGLALDLSGSTVADGSNAQCWQLDGSGSQSFVLDGSKHERTVADGVYVVSSGLGGRKVLDMTGGSTANGARLQIWDSNMTEAQAFRFTYDDETGLYSIVSVKSGKALDATDGKCSNGTAVQQWGSNGTMAQRWAVLRDSGGLSIRSALDESQALDVANASASNGAKLQLYASNGTAAQRFSLISTSPKVEGGRTVADGVYSLASKADPSKVLDVAGGSVSNGGNVQAWAANGTAAQRFRLTCGDDGFYTIQNLKSGKVLDVADANLVPGTNVQQWDANGTDAQKWAVRANADGSYTIVSKANGLALDLSGSTVADGSNAQCWQLDGSGSQSFVLDGSKHERTVADGVYVVSSGLGGRKVLDMTGGSTANGARLQIWDSNMTEAQAFRFTYDDETGLYSIVSVKSGKALDATDGKCSNGTAVQQWGSNGTMAQRWAVLRDSGGLSIRSALDESQALDVANASASNGAKLQLYASNGTAAQRFSLVSVEHEKVEPCADLHLDGWYEIAPTSNGGLRFDVADGSRSNGAKIQLYSSNSTLAQLFRFEYKDGCYRIISANSGKAIEMQNGSIVPGVPVVQESVGNDDAQKFSVVKGEDVSYTFKCVANSLSLDLNSVASGEKVVGNTSSSSFNLVEKSDLLAEGIYSFATALNEGKVLDVADGSTSDGANVQLYSSNGTFAQKWKVSKAEHAGNTYRFESIKSGKYLAVNGNNVCQKAYDENSEYQLWTPASIEAGAYILKNVGTGTVLDVSNASTTDGANIQVYSSNGSNAQRFFLKEADPVRGVTYALHSSLNYGQVIDVADGSSSDGANIQSWASNDTGAQKWNVYQNGDGTYRVINAANGKALDVKDGKAFAGANIQQYSWNGTAAQKWIIEYQGEGAFSLASMANRNLVIEVSGGSAVNGSNIQLGAKDGSAKQKFSFEETTYVPPMPSDKQVMLNRITGTSSGTQWLIAVDRSTHKVGVFRGSAGNWSMWYYWSCVTGAPATPTITGTYRTTGFKRDALSTDSRAIYCTQIWQGYFFHSILASESELGQSLSHGCIRMAYSSAKWIHDNIYAGTTVVIYN